MRKANFTSILSLGLVLMAPANIHAQCPAPHFPTLKRIAENHWYLTPKQVTPVSVDLGFGEGLTGTPGALASKGDGTVWVATPYGAQRPLRTTRTGAVQYSLSATPVTNKSVAYALVAQKTLSSFFSNPFGFAIDKADTLWVFDYNSVLSLVAENGATVGGANARPQYQIAPDPSRTVQFAYDGTSFWVADGRDGVYKVTPAPPSRNTSVPVVTRIRLVGPGVDYNSIRVTRVAFDGTQLWIGDAANRLLLRSDLQGNVLGSVALSSALGALAFDGTFVWATLPDLSRVIKVDSTGAIVSTVVVESQPTGIAFDGSYMWVANRTSNSISKICASSSQVVATRPGGGDPTEVVFDGAAIWITNPLSGRLSYRLE